MPVNVFIVDDSAFMRKIISDILNTDDGIHVFGTARNGKEAIEKLNNITPDVITLDVEMPVMDGLTCLESIMKNKPVPVIMLSSLTSEGADATIKALELGAIDFITKPKNLFSINQSHLTDEIIEKVKIASQTNVNTDIRNILYIKKPKSLTYSQKLKKIVAIGTSTGGPRALQQVLPFIPGNIPAAFVIVQHMPPGFTKSLAKRLDTMSELTVKEAEDEDVVTAGCAYIAPGDFHMRFETKKQTGDMVIKLTKEKTILGHRPSVNVMMESLSATALTNIIGVIMTGMGTDGCEGLKKLKQYNQAKVIAQDEQSCIVYGMPRVAVQQGIVDTIVPLTEISKEIIKMMGV